MMDTLTEVPPAPPREKFGSIWLFAGLIIFAGICRLLPHPLNFTPVGAMALFSGATLGFRRWGLLVPWLTLLVGDLLTGWHALMPVVYVSFAVSMLLGQYLQHDRRAIRVALFAFAGALQFYLLTNLASWWHFYPRTGAGLVECYLAGLPHWRNTLLGDGFYSLILFGGLAYAESVAAQRRRVQSV